MEALGGVMALFGIPLLVVWWIPYQVHEIGHLAGALLAGARFDYVPLGPFVLQRHQRHRLAFLVVRWPCGASLPKSSAGRGDFLITTASGVIANLIFGFVLVFSAIATTLPGTLSQLGLFVAGFFMAGHGLVHLIPSRAYAMPFDGRRLVDLVFLTPSGRRWMALKSITRASDDGRRPRDWARSDLQDLVQPTDGSVDDVSAALALHWHMLDAGNFSDAELCLRQALAAAGQRNVPVDVSQLVTSEIAFLEARRGADPGAAVAAVLRSRFVSRATLQRIAAAIDLRYGYVREARTRISVARADMSGLRPGFARLEHDLLDQLEHDADAFEQGTLSREEVTQRSSVDHLTALIDTHFVASDVKQVPPRAQGVFSARTVVGLVSAAMLAVCVFAIVYSASPTVAVPITPLVLVIAILTVLYVRARRSIEGAPGLRAALAAAAIVLASSSVLVGGVIRLYSGPYLWFVGQPRPCLTLAGPGFSSLVVFLFGAGFCLGGLVMGTRGEHDAPIPREGILLGAVAVALFAIVFSSDPSRLALLIGCGVGR